MYAFLMDCWDYYCGARGGTLRCVFIYTDYLRHLEFCSYGMVDLREALVESFNRVQYIESR